VTSAAAIAFTVIAATWGTRAMTRLLSRLAQRLKAREVQFNLAILVLFGLALLAEAAGVAASIGAFLAGMSLSESLDRRVHDFSHGVSELLTPSFWLKSDCTWMWQRSRMWTLCCCRWRLLLSRSFRRWLVAAWARWPWGWRNAIRIGAGMTLRGEFGMVVAQIGLGLGVISPRIYAVVVLMAIATTIIGPALLNLHGRVSPNVRALLCKYVLHDPGPLGSHLIVSLWIPFAKPSASHQFSWSSTATAAEILNFISVSAHG
jgi:Kef-type K+ transport system membrane component KefB